MSIIFIAALFFVIGVVIRALGENAPLPWSSRVAWILWAIAAILWFVSSYSHGLG